MMARQTPRLSSPSGIVGRSGNPSHVPPNVAIPATLYERYSEAPVRRPTIAECRFWAVPPLTSSGGVMAGAGGGIADAFTNDRHFRAAGFSTL